MKGRKSSLFNDPNRVGKGDWERNLDKRKVGETLDRISGNRDPKDYQKGCTFKKVYKYDAKHV